MSEYFVKTGVLKSLEEMGYNGAQTVVFNDGSVYGKTTVNAAGKTYTLHENDLDDLYSHYINYGNSKIQVKLEWFKDVKIELNKAAIVGKRVEVMDNHSKVYCGYCIDVSLKKILVSNEGKSDQCIEIIFPYEIRIFRTEKIIDLRQRP